MQKSRFTELFLLGGSAYVGLELLWRRRSHGSMFCAGGLSLALLGVLEEKSALSPPAKILSGAGIITAVELLTGLLVNRDHRVWDYRNQPGNFRGQICPAFCALWVPLSAAGLGLCRLLRRS